MKCFSNTRTKRHTAFAVLLVWLFALASGFANACLLQTPTVHSSAAGVALSEPSHESFEFGAKEACLKVCDDGSRAVPSAHAAADHTDPGPAPFVTTLWAAAVPSVSTPRRLDLLQVRTEGPPLRVRYSRLAL